MYVKRTKADGVFLKRMKRTGEGEGEKKLPNLIQSINYLQWKKHIIRNYKLKSKEKKTSSARFTCSSGY